MTRSLLRPFLPYLVLSAVHLVLLVTGPAAAVTATKALLMPALVAAVLTLVRPRRGAALVLLVVAICCSWAGDVLLSFPGETWFVLGLLSFLAAHSVYIALFVGLPRAGRLVTPWAALYAIWYAGFMLLLAPHLGSLFVPVAVYGLVLGSMAALAAGHSGVVAIGGALFVVSDSVLALGRFLPGYDAVVPGAGHDLIVMTTYLAAQGLIALGAILNLRGRALGVRARSRPARGRPVPATAP
ncbi:lysoplasmalogenase [Agromyces intestinalis]|uniref:Lysoplasmalogenase n=1 Tax=Agromyces intestinalis TaxID=2592652 RepID=A0A5C1YB97_9MICO|nr:lysoplasmalogenase [Agromyces intestinalis]QEO13354.1 lysoplasmalogenase [Agromyces intestinalis]